MEKKVSFCWLDWDKAGKGEFRPWIGESLFFKCWSEEEEWMQSRGWLSLPMARTDAQPSNSPEEIFLSTQRKWNRSRNALRPSGHTGQRKNLFTNCLEYHCLLADLVFIFCFQCYLVFVCFPAKPRIDKLAKLWCAHFLKMMVQSLKTLTNTRVCFIGNKD